MNLASGLVMSKIMNDADERAGELIKEYTEKGKDYTKGFLSYYHSHPVQKWLLEKNIIGDTVRYHSAKIALGKLKEK